MLLRPVAPLFRRSYGLGWGMWRIATGLWVDEMRRVVVIAVAGLSLAGCSSFSLDAFKSAPPTVQVQLESNPPGADAKTSLGPGCKTPCSVSVPAPESDNFSVSYALAKYQTATVQVQVTRTSGGLTSPDTAAAEPNPVVAELQPLAPPPKARKPMRPKKPRAPKAAAAPAPAESAFPDPNAAQQQAAPTR